MLETPMITKTNWTAAFLIPVPFWIIVKVNDYLAQGQ
jgi:hypothetical protein